MKIGIDSKELAYYQRIAVDEMNSISKTYEHYCRQAYEASSWWVKLKLVFKFPPSFRMYHIGEECLTGSNLDLCTNIRETWHSFWWITNQMFRCDKAEYVDLMFLHNYERVQLNQIQKFYKKDYENACRRLREEIN